MIVRITLIFLVSCLAQQICLTEDEAPARKQSYHLHLEDMMWVSESITQRVMAILLHDKLGFEATVVPGANSLDQYKKLAHEMDDPKDNTDLQSEYWMEGRDAIFNSYVEDKQKIVDGGPSGVLGRSGWYAPRFFVDQHPEMILDFWRAYQQRTVIDMLPPAEYTPADMLYYKPELAWAASGRWYPPHCIDAPRNCSEFFARNPHYETGSNEGLITTLKLDLMISYVAELDAQIADMYERQIPFIFYHWTPDTLLATYETERITFRPYSEECYKDHKADVTNGAGVLDCDFKTEILKKLWWSGLEAVAPDAVTFMEKMQLSNNLVQEMLAEHVRLKAENPEMSYEDLAFNTACNWVKASRSVWSKWVTLAPPMESCPDGEELVEGKCFPCAAGEFSVNSELCSPCPPGSFQPSEASTACLLCAPGTFQDRPRQPDCVRCVPGTFAATNGSDACEECPTKSTNFDVNYLRYASQADHPNSTTVDVMSLFAADSIDQCRCLSGYFGVPKIDGCVPCPTGGSCCFCADGTADCACMGGTQRPIPQPGFVLSTASNVHGADRPKEVIGDRIVTCQLPESCTGVTASMLDSSDGCAVGYTGPRCGSCSDNYFRFSAVCYECHGGHVFMGSVLLPIATIVVLVLFLWVSLHHFRLASIIVFADLCQGLTIMRLFQFSWPEPIRNVFGVVSVINFNVDLFMPDCVLVLPYYDSWVMWMLVPVLSALALVLVNFVLAAVNKVLTPKPEPFGFRLLIQNDEENSRPWILASAYLSFIVAIYTAIVMKVVEIWICSENEDGSFSLAASPSLNCYDDRWYNYQGGAIVCLLLYGIGIPVALMVYLWRIKNELHLPKNRRFLGLFYESYISRFYYWDVIDMGRNFLVVLAPAAVPNSPVFQSFWGLIVLMPYLAAEIFFHPFKFPILNISDLFVDATFVIYLICGYYFHTRELKEDWAEGENFMVGFLIAFLCLVLLAMLYSMYREIAETRELHKQAKTEKGAVWNMRRGSYGDALDGADFSVPGSPVYINKGNSHTPVSPVSAVIVDEEPPQKQELHIELPKQQDSEPQLKEMEVMISSMLQRLARLEQG